MSPHIKRTGDKTNQTSFLYGTLSGHYKPELSKNVKTHNRTRTTMNKKVKQLEMMCMFKYIFIPM